MKKIYFIAAVAAVAFMASCTGKKTAQDAADSDSAAVAADTVAAGSGVNLAAVAGTYEGMLPAADCPGLKTVITINADSTYLLQQDAEGRADGHDEASGVLSVVGGNVLMFVRPSSGEHTYYKVKDDDSIVMTDSLGNEPEGEMAKLYVLKRKK